MDPQLSPLAAYLVLLTCVVWMGAEGIRIKGVFFSGDPQYLEQGAKSSKIASLATGTVVDYKN